MPLMFRTLTADEIECRVAQSSPKGISLLLYKDARCDMNILDETVGPELWQRRHKRDNANCIVSIYNPELDTWISKEDTGTESNTEAAKGLASDSFKRACVNWGIGRELYTAPFIWIKAGDFETYQKNGKDVCKDRFEVSDIGYDNARRINRLAIRNANSGKTVFTFGMGRKSTPAPAQQIKQPEQPEAPESVTHYCRMCGAVILPTTGRDGTTVSVERILEMSRKTFSTDYCADCFKAARTKARTQSNA